MEPVLREDYRMPRRFQPIEQCAECHKRPVRKEWIEDLVVGETMKMVMDDKAIEAIVSMLMDL